MMQIVSNGTARRVVISNFEFEDGVEYGVCLSPAQNTITKGDIEDIDLYAEMYEQVSEGEYAFQTRSIASSHIGDTVYTALLVKVDFDHGSQEITNLNGDPLSLVYAWAVNHPNFN